MRAKSSMENDAYFIEFNRSKMMTYKYVGEKGEVYEKASTPDAPVLKVLTLIRCD
ncbi:hypothetical protein AEYBE204_05725 [Asticcacaulis sp. YBE204]|nr:hypothetical protein AEYBE204_05725 [Asticcacaulis sp. YBE204]